jgi:hypothetical protein
MQTAHHIRLYERAIRTKIGETLRTMFVPTEPTPKRLLELLDALEQPKGLDTGGTEEKWDEKPLGDAGANRVEVVCDANGQALVYLHCRVDDPEALQANVLTEDEARLIAINVAKLVIRRAKMTPSRSRH